MKNRNAMRKTHAETGCVNEAKKTEGSPLLFYGTDPSHMTKETNYFDLILASPRDYNYHSSNYSPRTRQGECQRLPVIIKLNQVC